MLKDEHEQEQDPERRSMKAWQGHIMEINERHVQRSGEKWIWKKHMVGPNVRKLTTVVNFFDSLMRNECPPKLVQHFIFGWSENNKIRRLDFPQVLFRVNDSNGLVHINVKWENRL